MPASPATERVSRTRGSSLAAAQEGNRVSWGLDVGRHVTALSLRRLACHRFQTRVLLCLLPVAQYLEHRGFLNRGGTLAWH